MSGIKKLAGQTVLYGLSSIVGRMLNYLLVPIYTRIFSPAEYGVVSELYSYSAFLLILFTYGMETAFFNFMQKEENKNKVYENCISLVSYTTTILVLLMIFFSSPLAATIEYPGKGNYIIWLALIIGFDAITAIPFARLRQQGKALQFALLKIAGIVINIGLNLFFLIGCPIWIKGNDGLLSQLAVTFYSPTVGVGYVFISNVIASGFTMLLLYRQFSNLTWHLDSALIKRMIYYAFPLLIAGFAGMVNETFDRAVYKYLAPDANHALRDLGIYSACYKLSIIMTLFVQTFRYAAEPFFFAQHDKEDKKETYAKVMTWFVITCSFIFLGVMLFIDVIKLFIGEQFRSGIDVVPVLLLANLCLGVFYNLSMWYKLTEKTRYGAYFSIFGAVLTIILLFGLIPSFGYMGAAWATFITYFAMMIVSFITGQKHYPIPYKVKNDVFYVLLSLMLFSLSAYLQHQLDLPGSVKWIVNIILLFVFPFVVFRMNKELLVKKQKVESQQNTIGRRN
ncbi:MAG TPA: oligosaccharide flippase family protein [Bacteroidia bacterium]|nr:oligosaccharide flippase family protein [Bacteroidia bacterium]